MGRPHNVSRETKLPGANGDREIIMFPCSVDHFKLQDWQPYPVDAQSADHQSSILYSSTHHSSGPQFSCGLANVLILQHELVTSKNKRVRLL